MNKNTKRVKSLTAVTVSVMFSMSVWFCTNAVLPRLKILYSLSAEDTGLLSIAIQAGFVAGAWLFFILNVPDIFKSSRFFIISAAAAAMCNYLFILFPDASAAGLATRFFTGFFLAGVYPTGIKLLSSWFKEDRSYAVSLLVGALTIGSGIPWLIKMISLPDWKAIIMATSLLSVISAIAVMLFYSDGPYTPGTARFSMEVVGKILRSRPVMYVNYGYFGHMWELYAMWVWLPVFLAESFQGRFPGTDPGLFVSAGMMAVFFLGGFNTIRGGNQVKKYGRVNYNIAMLAISGTSALLIGFSFSLSPFIALVIGLIWGMTVIPDSPHFSVMVTELAPKEYIGTALSFQTGAGFLIAALSIQAVSFLQNVTGWNLAFILLTIGPVIGIFSLVKLKDLNVIR